MRYINLRLTYTSESFLGKCKFKILGDGDMLADATANAECKVKILESAHPW